MSHTTISTSVKRTAKRGLASVLYRLGVMRLWQAWAFRNAAIVLMYHRVLSPDQRRQTGSHPAIVVEVDTFAMHMAVLRQRFRVLSLDEFGHLVKSGLPFPPGACVITFDDGWRDNLTHAWPILKEHGLPATIFLPVNFIGQRRLFWREALTQVLVRVIGACRDRPDLTARFAQHLGPVGLAGILTMNRTDARALVTEALSDRKHATSLAVDALVQILEAELGCCDDAAETPDQFLDWDQVTTLAAEGVTFGGHGADHVLLTGIAREEAAADINTSKQMLEAHVGPDTPAFAYPNGCWSPDVASLVRDAGFHLAFTTDVGAVRHGDDPLTIKRVNIHEDATSTAPLFLARVLGML
jgi:peptidoglycan/xylan/chitin deacetylase (PgdA/CDA1 family)